MIFNLVEESLLFRSGLNFRISIFSDIYNEVLSLKISESILIRKFNPDLKNKDSSTKLNILS